MSDCFCDYDPPSFYRSEKPVARKAYRCEECSGRILPGDRYWRVTGMWDGYISVFCTCEHCHDIKQWVQNNVPCFCFAHGGLSETAEQAVDDARDRAPEEAIGLRFGLLRRQVVRDKFHRARTSDHAH